MTAKFRLAAVLIVKDEATYLEEWIAYHIAHGVEHFFIYDNRSTDNTTDVLEKYINHGVVTLISFRQIGGQTDCYRHAARFFGPSAEWLTFTDVDEFFVLPGTERLVDFLGSQPEDVTQVQFPWRNFTFGGHIFRPDGLVIANFGLAEEIPQGGFASIGAKPVIRPEAVQAVYVHVCRMEHGRTIDPTGRTIEPGSHVQKPDYSSGQLNHYYSRSVEEFKKKMERGQVDGGREKGFFMPPPNMLNGGIADPVSDHWIKATEATLAYWRELSPAPHAFGSHLPGHPMHNFTQHKFELSLGHYLAGTPRLSAQKPPVNIMKAGWGYMVVDTGRPDLDLDDLMASIHLQDFLRHTCSKAVPGCIQPGSVHNFTVAPGKLRHKVAIVAVLPPCPTATDANAAKPGDRVLRGTAKTGGAAPLTFEADIPPCNSAVLVFRYFPHAYLPAGPLEISLDLSPAVIQASLVCLQE